MKTLIKLPVLICIALFISGCSSIAAKNKQFNLDPKATNKPSRQIAICRPSAFYHGLNSLGVRVNAFDAFDLGSGERFLLDLPVGNVELQILLPNQDPLFLRDRQSFKLTVHDQSALAYVIVGHNKGADNAVVEGVIGSMGLLIVETTWRASVVNADTFARTCGVDAAKTQYITDKSLN